MKKSACYFYFRYPQYLWAKEILKILRAGQIHDLDEKTIYDAPCGDGVIAYWLKKKIKNKICLLDIDPEKIDLAKKFIHDQEIEKQNLFELKTEGNENVWLLINSLFCLPDKENLICKMAPQMKYIIAIFPYIHHLNYKTFSRKNPGFANPGAMDKPQTIAFFNSHQYEIIFHKDITRFAFYKFIFPGLNALINRLLIFLERFKSNKNQAYWIGVFKRQ